MKFSEMRGGWAIGFLLLSLVLGPPLGLFFYNIGLPVFTSSAAYPALSQFGSVMEYVTALFLTGYLDGMYPAITAVILLFILLFNTHVLRLWWVLLTAYLSTFIWYFFQILINNMGFMIGFAAILSALIIWSVVKLIIRMKAAMS